MRDGRHSEVSLALVTRQGFFDDMNLTRLVGIFAKCIHEFVFFHCRSRTSNRHFTQEPPMYNFYVVYMTFK